MKRKIRIRFLILHYLPIYSGAAGALNKLINDLDNEKFEIEIVTTHLTKYKRNELHGNVKIKRIGYGFFGNDGLLNVFGKLNFFLALSFFSIYSRKYDVLHLIGSGKIDLPALFFSKIYNKKRVNKITRVGDDDPDAMSKSLIGRIVNSFLNKNTKHLIISPQILSICNRQKKWDKNSFYLIPNPVVIKFSKWDKLIQARIEKRVTQNKNQIKFLFVGVIAKHKGIHILVDLWNKYNINGQLVICGVALPSGGSAEIIEGINKNDNIIWKGRLNKQELEQEYLSSDAFLFPSFVEGLPNVMLESMSYGLPCVANRINGVTDFLLENSRGILIEDNCIEEWKSKIEEIIISSDNIKKRNLNMSLKAFEWVKINADSKVVSNKIENIYIDFWKE